MEKMFGGDPIAILIHALTRIMFAIVFGLLALKFAEMHEIEMTIWVGGAAVFYFAAAVKWLIVAKDATYDYGKETM